MSTSAEDILSSSLHSLYSYSPITFSDPGSTFTASGLTVVSPDPDPANWSLQASSLWIGSLFLANHLDDIPLSPLASPVNLLELGAGTGFPGILFAKRHPDKAFVTLSDYPDANILRTLQDNVERNSALVHVVGHAWGESTADLGVFDIVLAADTLWNSQIHVPFLHTLSRVLRKTHTARAYLVAGLHTGRWVIHRFLEKLAAFGLSAERTKERPVDFDIGSAEKLCAVSEREWSVERDGEDEMERRKWIIWIVVKWDDAQ